MANQFELQWNDFFVQVTRKKIKTIRLSVHPPDGEVRMSIPMRLSQRELKSMLTSRNEWLNRQRLAIQALPQVQPFDWSHGSLISILGHEYALNLIQTETLRPSVNAVGSQLVIKAAGSSDYSYLVQEWARQQMKLLLPELIDKWSATVGVDVADWGVKRMKTRWGSCNISARRIWLSLELASKPLICLEYVLVHELVHLHERYHNARFHRFMDTFMPDWREHEKTLTKTPSWLPA